MAKKNALVCLLVFGLIGLFGRLSPAMPLGGFLAWLLAFSFPIALLSIHGAAVRRTRLAHTFADQGLVRGYLAHGFWRDVFLFLLSVLVAFALLVNLALLRGQDWLWAGLAFPAFFLAKAILPKFLVRESVPWLRPARVNFWALALTPFLLGGARFLVLLAFGPDWALEPVEAPFGQSSSAFLKTAGVWAALFGTWGQNFSRLAQDFSRPLGFFFQAINSFCLYGGFLAIVAFLTLPPKEWRRGLSPPTEAAVPPPIKFSVVVGYSAFVAVFLLLALIPLAGWLETYCAGPKGAVLEETRLELKDRGERVFLFVGGKFYDPKAEEEIKKLAEALMVPIRADREDLTRQANQLFNQYRANVDRYLDWYYSLSGEYARLYEVVKGGSAGAEKYLMDKMIERLGFNVDAGHFAESVARFEARVAEYQDRLKDLAAKTLAHFEKPATLAAQAKIRTLTMDSLVKSVTPIETISFKKRLSVSGAVGLSSGAIAAVLVAKISQKAIFKLAAGTLAKMIAAKGISAGGGAAVGAGLGSVIPGPGTAIGAGIGFLVGVGMGLAIEKLMLNVEEIVNRDEFKLEIIKAIEEQRREVLRDLSFVAKEARPSEAKPAEASPESSPR